MQICDFEKDAFEAISKLSLRIPDEIVKREWENFKRSYRIEGFFLTTETDFGDRTTLAFAITRKNMFFEIMQIFLHNIALHLEVYNRKSEECNWRYIRAKAVAGGWTYIENPNYRYDAIYDARKLYFEYHIRFTTELFSAKKAKKLIRTYSNYINKWFLDTHWKFEEGRLEFVEISSSKEIDEKGVEHPQPDEIIQA